MTTRFLSVLFATALAAASCKPIHRDHTFDYAYPQTRRDLLVRWIGTPSGAALWISTADDGEDNGRYQGIHLLVDPGGPTDVETVVLPALQRGGLQPGMPVAYVVLTRGDAAARAGAARIAKEFRGTRIVAPGRVGPARSRGAGDAAVPSSLEVGPEVSLRLFEPKGAGGVDALAMVLRFIDVQMLLLPGHADGLADAMAETIGERLEKEGLSTTLVYAAGGEAVSPEAQEHLHPEVVVAHEGAAALVRFAPPEPGSVLEIGTDGSEIRAPGPRTRSRYGHWIDCSAGKDRCGADFALQVGEPVLVPIRIQDREGLFLLDTRAPFSYLSRPLYETIPGWRDASGAGHTHGGGQIGLEVPPFTLGAAAPERSADADATPPRSVRVHRWHVLPIEPFRIGEKEIAGVIGMDLLQSFRVELRPKENLLALTPNFEMPRERLPKAEKTTEGAVSTWDVPMDRSPGGPLILARADGEPRSLVVDLAAEHTRIYVRKEAWEERVAGSKEQVLSVFDVPDEIGDAAWRDYPLTTGALTLRELNLSGVVFQDTPALAVDRPLDTDVLGLDFLESFDRVSIDFRRRSIVLERRSG